MKNNFKRCLALLLAIMTIVGAFSIPVSAADECAHNWEMKDKKEPTCATQGYESWFCALCQKYEVRNITSRLDHEYVFVVEAKEPTCSVDGHPKEAYVCKNGCGMYYVERTMTDAEKDQYKKQPAISTDPNYDLSTEVYHKWGAPTVDGDACTKKEYDITYTCEYCDGKYVKPATGSGAHTFGALKITKAPTCVAVGSASRTCSTCKYVEKVEISKLTTHTYTRTEANLEYESKEIYYKNGSNDDKTLIKRAQHRSFYVCDVAGCTAREYVEGTKDTYVDCDNGNGTPDTDGWVLKGAASTCSYRATFERTCKKCGLTQTRKDWNQPFHKSTTVIDTQEKVHTNVEVKDGYKVYVCVDCNVQFKLYDGWESSGITPNVEKVDDNYAGMPQRYVPSNLNDHKWVDESVRVTPTCTQEGLKSQKCSEPGCVAKRNVSVAKAHDYTGAAKELVYPTCTTDGYVYQACIRCNYQKKLVTFKKFGSHSTTTYDAYTNIDKIVKNLKGKYEGLKMHSNNDAKAAGYVAPTETSIKAAQVEMGYKASTCFNEGVTFKVCSVCNAKVGGDTTKAKLNHKSEWIDSSVYGVYYGTGCYDDRYYTIECPNNACKTSTKVVVIAKNNAHDFSGEQVVFEEPTCYSKGVAGRVCQREDCGAKVEEKVLDFAINYHPHADKQIPSDQVTSTVNLPANGGSWNQPTINDFSCAEAKYQWMYCEDCHRNYRVEYAVSITDSMFLTAIGSTTATKFYYNGKVYDVAGYNSGDIVATTGKHTKIYLLSNIPTCQDFGKGTEVCLMCGASVKDVTVPKLAHTVGDTKYVAGTYEIAGTQTCAGAINWAKRCEVCLYEVEFGTYNALPHSFVIRDPADPNNLDKMSLVAWVDCVEEVNGVDVTLSATCAKEGKQQRKCVNCDYLEYRVSSKLSKHSTAVVHQNAVAATCTTTGFTKTYKCNVEGCGVLFTVQSNGSHKVVTAAPVVAATGHSVYSKFTKDGIHGNSGDDSTNNPVIIGEQIDVPGCGGYTANVVYCNKAGCLGYNSDPAVTGDKYVVGYTNYVVGRTHEVDETADRIKVEATCSTWEYTYLPCIYNCGAQLDKVDNKDVPKKMHLNKNGDILTGSCQLVLCADCDAADSLFCADCEELYVCVNVLTWKDEAKTQPDAICREVILPTHNYTKTAYANCNVVKSTCSDCGDVAWDNEEGGSVKVYHKYAVKVEPTIYAAGVEACTVCGYENPVKVPQLVALEFSMNFYNPLDENGPVVNGGKVYVRVDMKALEPILVNNIRVALAYDVDQLVFVGAVDNKSVFGELAQANAKDGVVYVFDDAGKERYNITIEGESEFVTLEFYVRPDAYDIKNRLDAVISFVAPSEDDDFAATVSYYDVDASTAKEAVYSNYAFDVTTNNRVNLKVDQLGDFNNNGRIDSADLAAVRDLMIDLINGVEGAEYNAVLDIDHDGDIDMDDYGYIKEYMVNKYTYWQFADLASYNEFVADEKENGVAKEDKELSELQRYAKWLGPVAPELV